jgi:hypothetical protein
MDRLYAKLCPKLKEAKFATMSDREALHEKMHALILEFGKQRKE